MLFFGMSMATGNFHVVSGWLYQHLPLACATAEEHIMSSASVWQTRANISSTEAAAILLYTAGALHVRAAPQHFGHSLAHGLFLLVVGLGELLWAAAFWLRPSPGLKVSGAVIAGASIVLWAITRVRPAPFGHSPEEIGCIDLASKLPEVLVLAILVLLSAERPSKQPVPAWLGASWPGGRRVGH